MESIESLRDYLIADEIQRIQSLPQAELVRELIRLRTEALEFMPAQDLLAMTQSKHGN